MVNWIYAFVGGPAGVMVDDLPVGLSIGSSIINGNLNYVVETYISPELAIAYGLLDPEDDDNYINDDYYENVVVMCHYVGNTNLKEVRAIVNSEDRDAKLKKIIGPGN